MEEDFDLTEDENDEPEATRDSAQEIFDTWKDQLKFFRSQYPKEYRFCFNSRRDIDDLVYSYMNEEYQKLLYH